MANANYKREVIIYDLILDGNVVLQEQLTILLKS